MFDRNAMAWSASSSFVWSCGSKLLRIINDVSLDDLSYQIKERAKARYGLQVGIRFNNVVCSVTIAFIIVSYTLKLRYSLCFIG